MNVFAAVFFIFGNKRGRPTRFPFFPLPISSSFHNLLKEGKLREV
jgi:hypothetical protein